MQRTIRTMSAALAAALMLGACAPSVSIRKEQAVSANVTEKVDSKFAGPKRRIGVVDFENKTAYGQQRLGTAATDILITELTKTGKFVVVERDKLHKIMDEQKLQASGAIDARTAVQVGKILGLNAIVTGAISEFGVKTEGSEYLIVQSKRQTAEATVDIRIVDAETGQVLLADSGKGRAASGKGSILGLGTRGGYDETLEGKSLRAAIAQFTENIVSQLNKKPWSCRVAAVNGNKAYLNAGPNMGVENGLKLDCYHLGKEIVDPTTGLSLGNEEMKVAKVKVAGPLGDSGEGSIADITEATGALSAKDICRLVD
ncbi:MAG: CsgG/HfaB family protein [Elusimicrobiota bacterium]|jgi:curli biogenesis system outer membrane secretion channel CsgG